MKDVHANYYDGRNKPVSIYKRLSIHVISLSDHFLWSVLQKNRF